MKLNIGDRIAFVRRHCLQAGIIIAAWGTHQKTERVVVASTDNSANEGIRRAEIAVHPDYIEKEAHLEPSTRESFASTWERIEAHLRPNPGRSQAPRDAG